MRLTDFAVDLAAVLSASRSVAAKHASLRARQLDAAYVKTRRAAGGPAKAGEAGTEAVGPVDALERVVGKTESVAKQLAEELSAALATRIGFGAAKASKPAGGDGKIMAGAAVESREAVPPDVDLHIFHTTRGAPFLGSLGAHAQRQRQQRQQPPGAPGAPTQIPFLGGRDGASHRADRAVKVSRREVTPAAARPPASARENNGVSTSSSSSPSSPSSPSSSTSSSSPSSSPSSSSPSPSPSPSPSSSPSSSSLSPPPSSSEQGVRETKRPGANAQSPATKPDPETELSLIDSSTPPTPQYPPEDTPSTTTPSTPYVLRESKVPATRLGRLWNYGGLAAGMLGGAIAESVSRAAGGSGQGSVLLSGANTERLVSRLSRMRGAALKLGQIMSFQDATMLPAPVREVLQRVQDRADYMPAWQRDRVLASNLGSDWRELFGDFEEVPVAAASIGQVHRATLRSADGRAVAVKVQFPGVADSINSDLDNLGMLLTATKLLPRGLYLDRTIANARTELGWECDYAREAACARRYRELLGDEAGVFAVPAVHAHASGPQVLTMDFMDGTGVTRIGPSLPQEKRDWIGTQILRLCLREIAEFRFMQTDPNWTNFLYNPTTHRLELLDFGAAREYAHEFARLYVRLLAAAARGDREALAGLSRELGYLTGLESRTMVDAHVDSILTLAEPFADDAPAVYDFRGQTVTERIKKFIPVMLRERLTPPPEETYSLHRKLSGAFLLCARLGSRVPCRELFGNALAKTDTGNVE